MCMFCLKQLFEQNLQSLKLSILNNSIILQQTKVIKKMKVMKAMKVMKVW